MTLFAISKCFGSKMMYILSSDNVLIGVFVFVSFFVRFLVFEIWSILYLTVVNSALGLSVAGFAKYAVDANLGRRKKYKIDHISKTKNRTKKNS